MTLGKFYSGLMLTLALPLHAFLALGAAPAAFAAEAKLEATFSDWMVYSRGEGQNRICYALSTPSSKQPASVNHGKVYFMVANWQNGAAKEQPSLLTGYPFKVTAPPNARIGAAKIPMYVAQNEAFVESNADEDRLIKEMRGGSVMRVSAVSERGTATSYEFSLKGITAALKKSSDICK